MIVVNEPPARQSSNLPAPASQPAQPAPGPLAPAALPAPPARARLRDDPTFHTAWAVHPVALYRRSRPGPWLQFRLPDGYEWNRVQLPVPNLPRALEGLRILHVSDFHLRRAWTPAYDHLLERIARDEPDLLLCTGDYVEDKHDHRPALPMVLRMVEGFRARLGSFGILGNHDGLRLGARLKHTRLTMLDGRRHELHVTRGEHGAAAIELIGLPGVHRRLLTDDFVRSVPRRADGGTLRIVLSHFPDHLRRTQHALQPDLFLTGHTHGGQVCLPGGWPVLRHDTLPRRLCTGVHWVDRTWLVVNRGFGYSGMPIRMFCPAEVLELTLTRMR